MNFVTVTEDDLEKLRQAMDLLDRLNEPDDRAVDLTFYGLTSNTLIIAAVKEAIADEADIDEKEVKIEGEAAVAIPLSSDVLYYLTGSGLQLRTEDVAYSKGGGNGTSEISLSWSGYRPKVTTHDFREMAIARDNWSASTFLEQYGKKHPATTKPAGPAHKEVTRESVKEHAPKPEEGAAAPATTSEVPKVTSSLKKKVQADIDLRTIEEFLD
jgi:hypothetical protein